MVKLRGIPSAEIGVNDWMTENLPGADSVDNDHVSDVVGNKTDTIAGDSLIALSKQIAAAVAIGLNTEVFPDQVAGVVVTSSATAWVLGAAANINTKYLDNAITLNPGEVEATRIPCTGHGFIVGQIVTIAGSSLNNGDKTITEISDADHFDFDDGSYNQETFAGTETAILTLFTANVFSIDSVSIENISANGVYQLNLYDDGTEITKVRFTKDAVQGGTLNIPIKTPFIAADSKITAKLASENAVGDTATISIGFHTC